MGQLNGILEVNGEKREISMDGFRDHSFGVIICTFLKFFNNSYVIFLRPST